MHSRTLPLVAIVVVGALASTSRPALSTAVAPTARSAQKSAPDRAPLSELWVEPETNRDLFFGVGGERMMPKPSQRFTIISVKKGGFSDGYTVRDPMGAEWSA